VDASLVEADGSGEVALDGPGALVDAVGADGPVAWPSLRVIDTQPVSASPAAKMTDIATERTRALAVRDLQIRALLIRRA
jgi:hypothetical protein